MVGGVAGGDFSNRSPKKSLISSSEDSERCLKPNTGPVWHTESAVSQVSVALLLVLSVTISGA